MIVQSTSWAQLFTRLMSYGCSQFKKGFSLRQSIKSVTGICLVKAKQKSSLSSPVSSTSRLQISLAPWKLVTPTHETFWPWYLERQPSVYRSKANTSGTFMMRQVCTSLLITSSVPLSLSTFSRFVAIMIILASPIFKLFITSCMPTRYRFLTASLFLCGFPLGTFVLRLKQSCLSFKIKPTTSQCNCSLFSSSSRQRSTYSRTF